MKMRGKHIKVLFAKLLQIILFCSLLPLINIKAERKKYFLAGLTKIFSTNFRYGFCRTKGVRVQDFLVDEVKWIEWRLVYF